jgi:hypothetical protein
MGYFKEMISFKKYLEISTNDTFWYENKAFAEKMVDHYHRGRLDPFHAFACPNTHCSHYKKPIYDNHWTCTECGDKIKGMPIRNPNAFNIIVGSLKALNHPDLNRYILKLKKAFAPSDWSIEQGASDFLKTMEEIQDILPNLRPPPNWQLGGAIPEPLKSPRKTPILY